MKTEKLLIEIARILENLDIPYLVTGGVAVAVWGRVRATVDIDVVIEIEESKIPSLAHALRTLSDAGYVDEERARDALRRKGEFNFIQPESGLKVDFWIREDNQFTQNEFERRIPQKIGGQQIYFISPEDLILRELQWYKMSEISKHLEDAKSILTISGKKLDIDYLKKWAKKLGLSETLGKLIKTK